MDALSMVEIAAKQRHVLLLKKVRNNQPLTAGELKELADYEHGMTARKKTTKKTKQTAAKKRPAKQRAAGKRRQLLAELAELAVSPNVTAAMAADKLGMTPAAFEKFLAGAEAGRVWRHAQIDALKEVGGKLWEKAKGGDAAAARQLLQGLQDKLGAGGNLDALAVKSAAQLVGEKPARLDYWFRRHAMPRNADGTICLKAFLEWWRRWLIAEHTFDPLRVKTVTELEPLLGVTRATLHEWIKQGLPRNADKSFSLPAVIKWRLEQIGARPQQAAAPLNPLADRKARKLQLEIDAAEKKLIPRLAVELGWVFYASSFAAVLDRKEGELPGLLADCKSADEIKDVLATQFEQIRRVAMQAPEDIVSELPAGAAERMQQALDLVTGRPQ